jgi:hypothetical protein
MADTAALPRSRALSALAPLLLVLALSSGMMALLYARQAIPYNADMAVVALMAQDILYRDAHPIFYDSSEYAGTLEQHWVALLFAFLPDGVIIHRLGIALLLLGVVALVWTFTREAFGERAALAAGLYLALGPLFFYYRGLTSEGPYTPIHLIGAGILALLIRIEKRALEGKPFGIEATALGLLFGLGWWTHPLVLVFGGSLLAALAAGKAWRRLTPWGFLAAVAAFFLASFPWWWRNLCTGWASLAGPEAGRATAEQALEQAGVLARIGVPVLLGARPLWAEETPTTVVLLSWAVLLTGLGLGAFRIFRDGSPLARYAAAVLLPLPLFSVALALQSYRTNFQEPRLIYATYFVLAPFFGVLVTASRGSRWTRSALLGAVASLHLAGHVLPYRAAPLPHEPVRRLLERGADHVYTTYWMAFPLVFLSKDRIAATPFGRTAALRMLRLRREVDASPAPAFLYEAEEAVRLDTFLLRNRFAYRREDLGTGSWRLFTGLDSEAVARIRGCACIPSGLGPEAVRWQAIDGPRRVATGATVTYPVRLANRSNLGWWPGMNLSYHWVRPDGSYAVFDGLRTTPGSLPGPGGTLALDLQVAANVPPGDYTLVIDVVEEGVAWFENLGAEPLRLPVRVE